VCVCVWVSVCIIDTQLFEEGDFCGITRCHYLSYLAAFNCHLLKAAAASATEAEAETERPHTPATDKN